MLIGTPSATLRPFPAFRMIWVEMEKRTAAGDTEVLPLSPLPQLSISTKTCLSVVIITFFCTEFAQAAS